MPNVLLVEDDPKIAAHILTLLRAEGWSMNIADSRASLNDYLTGVTKDFSLIILDRLLNQFDTKNIFPMIRKTWPDTPILVLSAINTPIERAELLDLGVDDYLGKPFLNQELIARARALSRRAKRSEEAFRHIGNTVLDFNRFSVQIEGKKDEVLPHKEFLLLKYLTRESGKVWSRDDLLTTVWGPETSPESNVVEATVNSLRRRLEAAGSNLKLKNLRNAGYFVEG